MIRRLKHYELIDMIGRGGTATVYRGRDLRTGAIVAVKVLHPQYVEHPDGVRAFRRLAAIARLEGGAARYGTPLACDSTDA